MIPAESVAFAAGLFVALDNALLVQAQFALSDSVLIALSLASILLFVVLRGRESAAVRRDWALWLAWGVLTAAALLVKFSAQFILWLVPVYALKLFLDGRRREVLVFAAVFGLAFVFTTAAVWQLHFSLIPRLDQANTYEISGVHRDILERTTHPDPFTKFYVQLRDALIFISNYHKGVPNLDLTKPGEIGSPWYQWPLGGRAINYRWETPEGQVFHYIYLFGNPATWLLSLLGVIGGTGLVISDLLFRFLPEESRRWPYVFVLLYWVYMIAAMFVRRVLYLYHYLPPLILGIILFALVLGLAARLSWRTRRDVLLLSLAWVVVGYLVYRPLTTYGPLTNEQFQRLNVWPAWDLRCARCAPEN
jgi:dolichyl-phosphate-mannose--protein O-mannosyl transferase